MSVSKAVADQRNIEQAFADHERVRLMREGLINNSSFIVSGLVGIVLVPIMLRGLGAESYGLWVAMLAMAGVVGLFDLGLGWVAIRQIAAGPGNLASAETSRFVSTAANVCIIGGVIGALFVGALGLALGRGLHLSAATRMIAPYAFALACAASFANLLFTFTTSVLRGLRRFGLVNTLSIAATLLRGAGIIVLIRGGSGLLPILSWQLATGIALALAGIALVNQLEPSFRFQVCRVEWNVLRRHIPHGLAVQASDAVGRLIWDVVPIIVGLRLGPQSIATFSIAQKFPLFISQFSWTAAGPLYPAAAQHHEERNGLLDRQILATGMRWIAVAAIPLCLIPAAIAPQLLRTWLGEPRPEVVSLLRILIAGVFAYGLGAAPTMVLWAWGAVRSILLIEVSAALATVVLSAALLPDFGLAGAASAFLVLATAGAIALFHSACNLCGVRYSEVLGTAFHGLTLPALACFFASIGSRYIPVPGHWVGVIVAVAVSGGAYAACMYFFGARREEREFVQGILRLPAMIAASLWSRLRKLFGSDLHPPLK